MAVAPTLHYPSSRGDVLISEMAYTHLVNAVNKRSREVGGNPDEIVDALRAEMIRRTRDGVPDPTPLQPPPRGAPSRGPDAIAKPAPTATDAGHTREDNLAPADADPLKERLEENHAKLINDAAQLEMEAGSLPREVNTDEDVAAINAWLAKAQGLCRTSEAERKGEKDYYLRASRVVDGFFGGIADGVRSRMQGISNRMVPFLQAKRAREEAERTQAAAELRRSQEEAQRRVEEERAAADRLRQEAEAARQRLINAVTPEEIEAAEQEFRDKARDAHLSDQAADQAIKDARKVEKAAVREEKILDGTHSSVTMGKVQGGGAASRVVTSWKADVHNRSRLTASLGPLAPYLSDQAVDDALKRAAKAETRPAIPGVDFVEDVQVKTHARAAG